MQNKDIEKIFGGLIREKVSKSLQKNGLLSNKPKTKENKSLLSTKKAKKKNEKKIVKEALVVNPVSFLLKTEKLSKKTKEAHEAIYKRHCDTFNKLSSELDAVGKQEACDYHSLYRSYKIDECRNLNAVKLHELYFYNISDLASEITVDSLAYIKLARNFGTFEDWQFDFIACAMSAREGWALLVYEPYRGVYMNVCVDGDTNGIPLGCVPVLVLDMWDHAFFKDYDIDKRSYIIAMMREINWDVIEARMALAEKCELDTLYNIRPLYNDKPEKLLTAAGATEVQDLVGGAEPSGATSAPASPAAPGRVLEPDKRERGY